MMAKPKHMMVAFPLVTTMLCVSRKEFFAQHWLSFVDNCFQKFNKDKYTRLMALGCISRLTWTYLFRCAESTAITFKKLDTIVKTLFPAFRRATNPTDIPLDHFILITYYALMRDTDTALNDIVYYLLNIDNSAPANTSPQTPLHHQQQQYQQHHHNAHAFHWEFINPERIVIAIRAFLLLLTDLEHNRQRPPFPVDTDMAFTGLSSFFHQCSADALKAPMRGIKPEASEKVEDVMAKSLLGLDHSFGRLLVLDEKNIIRTSSSSALLTAPPTTNSTSAASSIMMISNSSRTASSSTNGTVVSIPPHNLSTNVSAFTSSQVHGNLAGSPSASLISHAVSNNSHMNNSGSFINNKTLFGQSGDSHFRINSVVPTATTMAGGSFVGSGSLGNSGPGAPGGSIISSSAAGTLTIPGSSSSSSVSPSASSSTTPDASGPQMVYQYSQFAVSYAKDKQPYFDLLRTMVDAMPRLMPAGIPLPQIVEMLSRYTVHLDPELVQASSLALRRIARQIDSQTVVMGYARFIQRIEDKVMDVVDSLWDGMTAHLDDTTSSFTKDGVLDLYVELLAIWVEDVDLASLREIVLADPSPHLYADVQADVERLFQMVVDTEAMGLMFLCHQSPCTRRIAMRMVDWAARLETRLLQQVHTETTIICASNNNNKPSALTLAFVDQLLQYTQAHKQRQPFARLLDLMQDCQLAQELLQFDKDKNLLFGAKLSIETRLRLQQHQRRTTSPLLSQLATADDPTDQWIWNTCFMGLLNRIFGYFPATVAQCRAQLCERLLQIQPALLSSIEMSAKTSATGTLSIQKGAASQQKTWVSVDLIDQWKVYLSFVCATASNDMMSSLSSQKSNSPPSLQNPSPPLPHQQQQRRYPTLRIQSDRKGSAVLDHIQAPDDLIRLVLPFLPCDHRAIREASIQGLGHLHADAYYTLIHLLQPDMRIILEEGKHRTNQKPYQNKRNRKNDRLRTSLLHVLALTVHCLRLEEHVPETRKTAVAIMAFVKETKVFLADTEVQLDWEYHKLRVYLCQLVEHIYKALLDMDDPTAIMSFETRLSLYKMFEEWCGYGAHAQITRTRDASMIRDVLEQCKDAKDRAHMTKLMEEERKALETASLNAMAMLCRGPSYSFLGQKKARQAVIQFDMLNVLRWIDAVFESPDPKHHLIARNALEAVLIYNQDQPLILDDVIEQCYAGNPKLEFTQGYFLAIVDIVTREENFPCQVKQIISLALFKAGDAKKSIRKAAMQLLRVIEERVFGESCAKEYEIGILSSLPTIYKHTQTLLSARLAVDHPGETYDILSEMTQRFEHISPNSQRDVLIYMLPWLRRIDLSFSAIGSSASSSSPSSLSSATGPNASAMANAKTNGPRGSLTPTTAPAGISMMMLDHPIELNTLAYVVLTNLYYITIKFGDTYVKEIGALWTQLADQSRNVRPIITYLLELCLEKRNPWFLVHAKRVFVCLGRTAAFDHMVEEVVGEITPRSMVPQVLDTSSHAMVCRQHPSMFIADTDKVLPPYAKKPAFARGQLALVFLVDLAIEAGADLAPHLPLLLHCIVVHLDHLTSIICDQARCLLINLIHAIVVRQALDDDISADSLSLIQWLTSKEGKRLWAYENISPTKNRRLASTEDLKDLVHRILTVFSTEDPDLRQKWGETALKWATCCSVRHIACRSFQCFRGLLPAFNQHMLADMLVRLSNTIADKSEDIRGFSLEILLTLTQVARAMDGAQIEQFPQLFWAGIACLYGPYPSEQVEALNLLTIVLDQLKGNTDLLASTFPIHWASEFDGLQPLLLKGLQHDIVEEANWKLLRQTMGRINNLALVDPTQTRFLFLFLGTVPRLLHGLEVQQQKQEEGETEKKKDQDESMADVVHELALLAQENGLVETHRLLQTYPKQKAKFQADYLKQLIWSLGPVYLDTDRQVTAEVLMFVLRMTNNAIDYYRDKSLMLLEILLPYSASKSAEPIQVYIESLQPLLNLIDQPAYADRALSILNQGIMTCQQPTEAPIPVWRMSDTACTKMTRKNVYAVVYECASTQPPHAEDAIQFSVEDFSLLTGDPRYNPVFMTAAAGLISTSPTARSSMEEPGRSNSSSTSTSASPHHHYPTALHASTPQPMLSSPTLSPTTMAPPLTPSTSTTTTAAPMVVPPQPSPVYPLLPQGEDLVNALKDLDDFFNEDTDSSPPTK
ncbi:hypothetical protein DM01DRAFT_1331333 [Hesseltinella vesiculosa]|uniref:Cell morphogenesis protein n=1 Tax=Hesseltinella vesiculosa TaxID=101127 RepID=A0A1X2GUZ5_9FUNG|nr:hypothetical protein DM01DRAFT_1331333 [Hesseltinella vesiculosa]